MKLTVKQRKFCDNYIKLGDATEAAIRAGYSKKTASVIGYENLNKPYLAEYIEKGLQKIQDSTIATAEEVLQYLTRVARGEEKEYKMTTIDGERKLIEVNPELKDRTKAAELLGKRYALFVDRQEVDVTVSKSLEDFFGAD